MSAERGAPTGEDEAVIWAVAKRLDDGWVAEVIPEYDRIDPATKRPLPRGVPGQAIPDRFSIKTWAKARSGKFEPMSVAEASCVLALRATRPGRTDGSDG